jgi:DNA-binding sugar fermentation-stimulating protein
MAASQTDAYCFTALVLFFMSERLVREKDAHEKFDNRYRREYREMIASFYADEAFTVSIEKGTFTIHMLSICKKECSRKY